MLARFTTTWEAAMSSRLVAVESRSGKVRRLPSAEQLYVTDVLELIAPGTYEAIGCRGRLVAMFKTTKLLVPFIVLVPDTNHEHGHRQVRLFRAYNAEKVTPDRRVIPGRASDLQREASIALDRRLRRRDRVPVSVFDRILFRVVVRTVTRDSRQHQLHRLNEYSVVDRVLERIAGGTRI